MVVAKAKAERAAKKEEETKETKKYNEVLEGLFVRLFACFFFLFFSWSCCCCCGREWQEVQ